jgi:hypothetical protein
MQKWHLSHFQSWPFLLVGFGHATNQRQKADERKIGLARSVGWSSFKKSLALATLLGKSSLFQLGLFPSRGYFGFLPKPTIQANSTSLPSHALALFAFTASRKVALVRVSSCPFTLLGKHCDKFIYIYVGSLASVNASTTIDETLIITQCDTHQI